MNRFLKRKFILFILIFLSTSITLFCSQSYDITLLSPKDNTLIVEDSLNFRWECLFDINRYLLVITLEDESFRREILVFDDNSKIIFTLHNIKSILKRSGIYKWQVKAVIKQEEELLSPIRIFRVKFKNGEKFLPPFDYIHALEFQVLSRYKTSEFNRFLKNVNSKYCFQDFKSLGIVFQQKGMIFSSLDFLEKLYLISQTGMGFSVKSRMNLNKNLYFSLYPALDISAMWFSTGINRFSSNIIFSTIGFDLEIMPRRFMAISIRWLPDYKINYSNKEKKIKVFNGEGWQISLEFVISNNIIRKFELFGMKIDLEKIPIRYTYNRIKDNNSNQVIETQMIYFIYLI